MKKHYILLFGYEKWATGKVLDAMKQLPEQDEKCVEWMAHILMAQLIWYSRSDHKQINYTPWEKKKFDECLKLYNELSILWFNFCNNLTEEDLMKVINYTNSKGESYQNTLQDILTHVINHSTYHRGQIIAKLKGQLPSLPSTDFILFRR